MTVQGNDLSVDADSPYFVEEGINTAHVAR